jgi:hypothetical protein
VKTHAYSSKSVLASKISLPLNQYLSKIGNIASVIKSTLLLGITITLPAGVFAGNTGGVPSNHKFGLVINEGALSWDVDMSEFLNYDASTGALTMPTASIVLRAGWEWAPITMPGTGQSVQGLKWHSQERNEDNSAWRTTFTLTASGNVDPFMTYALSVRNNTSVTQTYTFTYGEALIPPVIGLYDIYADITGGVTNGTGPTVKVSPTIPDLLGDNDGLNEIQVLRLSTDGGATFVNAGVDVGIAIETAGTSPYGTYSSALSTITALPFNYWEITTQFTLSPGKDTAVFTGFVEIRPDSEANIPEPSTYALVLGVISLGFVAYQRRIHAT